MSSLETPPPQPLTPDMPAPGAIPEADQQRFARSLRSSRIILPVLLGVAAVAWLFYRQFDPEQFKSISWTWTAFAWIGTAFLLLVVRHFFYALRLKAITGHQFSWRKCMELMVIWEFSSALTPTSKGGPFVMLFALTKEGLSAGRTTATVFYAMVCDSGFFVLSLPLLLGIYGPPMLYPGMTQYSDVGLASGTFFVTYGLMSSYWLILVFFLLIRPSVSQTVLGWIARRRIMLRWGPKLVQLGRDFTIAAAEMRSRPWKEHLQVIVGTLGVWTCKFAMINCLIIAIVPSTPLDGGTQAFIYARLVAMFIIMTFSPTPGGAGLAELALANFISDYVPVGIGLVVALLWRGMAYYGYLLLGAIIVPAWIRSKIKK